MARKEVFRIKPFKHIQIADPWYLEEYVEDPVKNKHLEEFIAAFDVPDCKFGKVRIKENVYTSEYDGSEFSCYEILAAVAPEERHVDTYLADKFYGELTVKDMTRLGCDTARFEIMVDDRVDVVHTGADGHYGDVIQFIPGYGAQIRINLDGGLFDFEDVMAMAKYWFEEIEE